MVGSQASQVGRTWSRTNPLPTLACSEPLPTRLPPRLHFVDAPPSFHFFNASNSTALCFNAHRRMADIPTRRLKAPSFVRRTLLDSVDAGWVFGRRRRLQMVPTSTILHKETRKEVKRWIGYMKVEGTHTVVQTWRPSTDNCNSSSPATSAVDACTSFQDAITKRGTNPWAFVHLATYRVIFEVPPDTSQVD